MSDRRIQPGMSGWKKGALLVGGALLLYKVFAKKREQPTAPPAGMIAQPYAAAQAARQQIAQRNSIRQTAQQTIQDLEQDATMNGVDGAEEQQAPASGMNGTHAPGLNGTNGTTTNRVAGRMGRSRFSGG